MTQTQETFKKNFSKFTTILVLLFAVVLTFESIGNNIEIYKQEFALFDAFISGIFLIEYIYIICTSKHKWKYITSFEWIVDILSFLPFFLGVAFTESFKLLRLFRILRVLRILRLVKSIPLTDGFIKAIKNYKEEYKAVGILAGIMIFVISSFVYYAEKDLDGTLFTSIPISLWWWVVTATTVWYWDMAPITTLWRLFWTILVFVWPLILSLASAITIMVFMETKKKNDRESWNIQWWICDKCKYKNPTEWNYCMICWDIKNELDVEIFIQKKK